MSDSIQLASVASTKGVTDLSGSNVLDAWPYQELELCLSGLDLSPRARHRARTVRATLRAGRADTLTRRVGQATAHGMLDADITARRTPELQHCDAETSRVR